MSKTTKFLTLVAVLFVLAPITAAAQRRRGLVDVSPRSERHGFWISLGAGAGSENYRYSNVPGGWQDEDNVQPTFSLILGGTVSPYLRLGGELTGWVWDHRDPTTDDKVTSYLGAGLLVGQVYPAPRTGFFLKGGLGLSRSGESVYGSGDVGETGFSYLVGAGYEIKLGRQIFLTPIVSMLRHRSTNPDDPDNLGTFHERVWNFGVGLVIQPGR